MSVRSWFRNLAFVPARIHLAAMTLANRIEHARLNKGGNSARRGQCCGPRPDSFPEGKRVEDIPELRDILKQTGFLLTGYYPAYRCTVCGQEWFRDWEQLKSGGNIHVRKAT